ncbi:MAG: hypothetical protein K0R54_30 [Clostridiaceae bacterium]|nr:hypothetical protein [Clostridiaceae bacterium]
MSDTIFSENPEDVNFDGAVSSFKTGDVALMLNETTAMIRYYCREFEEFIGKNHTPGEHRIYTYYEINRLKYIIYLLKNKNYSVKQAKEFLSTPQGRLMSPIEDETERVRSLVQIMTNELRVEISAIIKEEMNLILDESMKKLNEPMQNINEKVEELVKKTIDNSTVFQEKLETIQTNTNFSDIKDTLEKIDGYLNEVKNKELTENENKKKSGFFARLFGK